MLKNKKKTMSMSEYYKKIPSQNTKQKDKLKSVQTYL